MRDARLLLDRLFASAVAAVEPAAAVRRQCQVEGDTLIVGAARIDLRQVERVIVVGAGKASAPMAQAIENLLGERVAGGVVVVKHGHASPLRRVRCLEAGHPVPDAAGEMAALALESALSGLSARDLVIACISGGASALLPAPRPPLTLADKQAVTRALLGCGAAIAEINAVRKHLSRLKGGQLARLAMPARVVALILSDVIGDDLTAIASGPTAPDPTTFAEVAAIIARHDIASRLPTAVAELVARGVAGCEPETPKPGDPCFAGVVNQLVGSNRLALAAAAATAHELGLEPVVIDTPIIGEARRAAADFCARAMTIAAGSSRPRALIAGGEVIVTLGATPGRGGRAQEFTLASALALGGCSGIAVLAAGTDGNDGPTDAAGAVADGSTLVRAAALGLSAREHLDRHDANPYFAALGDLVLTGPTRTNVMDCYLAVIAAE